jgi:hypothetical protein
MPLELPAAPHQLRAHSCQQEGSDRTTGSDGDRRPDIRANVAGESVGGDMAVGRWHH